MATQGLERTVKTLDGVGPAVALRLERLGITTIRHLLLHFPFRWEDYSQVAKIRDLKPGLITVAGEIEQVAARRAKTRRLHILEAIISDGSGTLKAVWFNQPYLLQRLHQGTQVILSGKLEFRNNDYALQSPNVEFTDRPAEGHIVPVYPETAGLTSKQISALASQVIDLTDELLDELPDPVIKNHKLIPLAQAVRQLHQPQSSSQLAAAKSRMAFAELFLVIACGLIIKSELATEPAQPIKFQESVAKQFTSALDFELTDAQRKAAWQVLQDITLEHPMNRLLEGDVGSGKTVVAAMAAVMAAAGNYQTALMVPTEVLAAQHVARLKPLLEPLGYQVAGAAGKIAAAEREQLTAGLKSGTIKLVIGTQALLSSELEFERLGLVIIDEQHRFGVEQRQLLKAKAGYLPHLLSMTATPIPRTLALTIYGDLDISVIDELPTGRKPIITKVISEFERPQLYKSVDAEIEAGRQVFVVCPVIEESDTLGVKSVTAEVERLRRGPFSHRRIALLHGRVKSEAKTAIMAQFAAGEFDILVATSLIEVGVDVPQASVMMIEGAERFGLATLHQLRGRVGRSHHQSYCYLFSSTSEISPRLRAMERSHDGLRLAQIDLQQRGAGQIYGLRQHGKLDLRFADTGDAKLLASVRQAAKDFVGLGPEMLKYEATMARINQLKTVTSLD